MLREEQQCIEKENRMMEFACGMILREKGVCYQIGITASHYDEATDTYEDYKLTEKEFWAIMADAVHHRMVCSHQ
jgi:hypothetical protein